MNKLTLKTSLISCSFFFTLLFVTASKAFAIDPACMLCVVTVGAGLAISRALGIDDALVGVWVGGAFWALATWTGSLLQKKFPKVKHLDAIYLIIFYAIVLFALYKFDYFQGGFPVFGFIVNPLLLGMVVGTTFMIAGISTDEYLRTKKADGKAFFPFQKVIVPLLWLILGTFFTWLMISI